MRATGFGSTVEPEENWTSARSDASRAIEVSSPSASPAASTTPRSSAGPAAATARPITRATLPDVTSARAPETRSMRAVASAYSSMRPSRTGG